MRLGQLARKLTVRPDQIVEFLASKNIQIENGSNTRLDDIHVALLVEKFGGEGFEMTPQELATDDFIPEVISDVMESPESEKVEDNNGHTESPVLEAQTQQEKQEVIKAPKVELSGLKVPGKIDLPEPKKKEQLPTEALPKTERDIERKPQERAKLQQNRNPKTNPRPAKNPIALQREREEMEAQKKREEAKALEKEKRAQHYFNRVKVVAPVKALKREQVAEEIPETTPEPKSLLGKFFRWFTT